MTDEGFVVRPMAEQDAQSVAAWRYAGKYAFYDADADADDLAELLDPDGWGQRYFAVDNDQGELVGLFVFKVSNHVAQIGLGLRPDLTGQGLGGPYLRAGLRYAALNLDVTSYALAVAAFNQRAITVYERAGFREVERYNHSTNGGVHAFVRMSRGKIEV